jgi:hypothetical protein
MSTAVSAGKWSALFAIAIVSVPWTASTAVADDSLPPVCSLYHPYAISRALDDKAVQEDLNMTPGQAKAVKAVLDRVRKQHSGDDDKVFKAKGSVSEKTKMVDDNLDRLTRDTFYALPGALRQEQVARLKQILHQEKGSALIQQPDVCVLMKISDEQLGQLKAIQEGLRKDLIADVQSGKVPRADASRYDQLLLKRIHPKVQEALTVEQRKILKELLGVRLVRGGGL